jgi:hypothetical protein
MEAEADDAGAIAFNRLTGHGGEMAAAHFTYPF